MVSRCRVCGAKTTGHRQYCPDCREAKAGGSRNLKFDTSALSDYIIRILSKGYTLDSIKNSLEKRGYSKEEINLALEYLKQKRETDEEEEEEEEKRIINASNERKIALIISLVILVILIGFTVYNNVINKSNNTSTNQTPIPPSAKENLSSEELKEFCSQSFYGLQGSTKTIETIEYFEDENAAVLWLEKNYPYIEGVTQNFPENFKNNRLNKAEFPIYLIQGIIKGDSYFSNLLYACDKNGLMAAL